MTYEEIRTAITARTGTFNGIERARIDYQNAIGAVFAPPLTGLWCRMTIQHATAFFAGMADRPHSRKPGQIVFQCFARPRSGMKPLNDLTDALEAHFGYWSAGDLECMEASQVVVGDDGNGFYQINVNIRFRAG